MKYLLLFFLTFSLCHAVAQDHWTVTYAKKEILRASAEDTLANRILMKRENLKKRGAVRLRYYEVPDRNDWKRTLIVQDNTGKEWLQAQGPSLKLRRRTLREMAAMAQPIAIYTSSLPADPERAATVRVRRVHLCTLLFAD
jgi:hypothetical protein